MMKKSKISILFLIVALVSFLLANVASVNAVPKKAKPLKSGIMVKTVIGPVSPVAKVGQPNEKPYKATIIVKSKNNMKEISRFTTDDNGNFKFIVKPGTYILEPVLGTSLYPKAGPVEVVVKANKLTSVVIRFDSGIR